MSLDIRLKKGINIRFSDNTVEYINNLINTTANTKVAKDVTVKHLYPEVFEDTNIKQVLTTVLGWLKKEKLSPFIDIDYPHIHIISQANTKTEKEKVTKVAQKYYQYVEGKDKHKIVIWDTSKNFNKQMNISITVNSQSSKIPAIRTALYSRGFMKADIVSNNEKTLYTPQLSDVVFKFKSSQLLYPVGPYSNPYVKESFDKYQKGKYLIDKYKEEDRMDISHVIDTETYTYLMAHANIEEQNLYDIHPIGNKAFKQIIINFLKKLEIKYHPIAVEIVVNTLYDNKLNPLLWIPLTIHPIMHTIMANNSHTKIIDVLKGTGMANDIVNNIVNIANSVANVIFKQYGTSYGTTYSTIDYLLTKKDPKHQYVCRSLGDYASHIYTEETIKFIEDKIREKKHKKIKFKLNTKGAQDTKSLYLGHVDIKEII